MEIIFLLLPLIPYFKVLPEVINPVAFIFISFFIFKNRKEADSFDLILSSVLVLGVVSTFLSKDKLISLLNSPYILIFIPVFILARGFSKEQISKANKYIFYGGSIAAFLSIIRFLFNTDSVLDGLFNYANASAIYFGSCALIFFSQELDFESSLEKTASRLGIIALTAALLLTQSRAGLLVYAAAIIITAISKGKVMQNYLINVFNYSILGLLVAVMLYYRQYVVLLLALPVIIYLALKSISFKVKGNLFNYLISGFVVIGAFAGLRRLNLESFYERLVFYEDGLKLLKHNLFGIGAGRFSYEQFAYQTAMYDVKYIHNGFLQVAIDFGIIFFLIYFGLIFYVLFRNFNRQKLGTLQFVIPMMILVHSLIDFSMSFILLNIILWFYLGTGFKKIGRKTAYYKGAIALFLAFEIALAAFLPGELVYNMASFSTNSNYSLLKVIDKFPVKTVRYYDKLSVAAYSMYKKSGDINYLKEAEEGLNKCLNEHGADGRIYELLGKVYFALGDYDKAVEALEDSVMERKYYIVSYDALIEGYYNMYKKDKLTKEQYAYKLKTIEDRIISLGSSINNKSKYMKNQADGSLNAYEKMRIEEIKK
ncbi:O-antigen ligase family protein [Clostridium swellfunianum]|uniref:O-antigen ligase family protein n=1 Tax=Clostridium swellfunianum TaxID=1367462 RepID=UPI00202E1E62|nr:O-antigen ligase family protein [Clostridium swellfunianum]MCM0647404.1 O-antigen ligase family protein [Clostridium swellfunianum]